MTAPIGPYEVVGELGRGAMGRVLKGRHRTTGVLRALKVVLDPQAGTSQVARFKREAELLARVGGDAVVAVHDSGLHGGSLWYAMDLCERGSLRTVLEARKKLPWREAAATVVKVARALERCHGAGVIHRDVKPENVLLDDRGEPRLSDFGCARDLMGENLTKTGSSIGTALYMAPEQLRGARADERADVWGLAVVLHELVAGAGPFDSCSTWVELLTAAEGQKWTRLHALDPANPRELDTIIERALAPVAQRTPRPLELAASLEALLATERLPAVGGRSLHGATPVLLATAGLLLLATLAGIATWRLRAPATAGPPPPDAPSAISIDEPREGATVANDDPVAVSGRVERSLREVTVNGVRATLAADGRFTASVVLPDPTSAITVAARNLDGAVEVKRLVRHVLDGPAWLRRVPRALRAPVKLPPGVRASDTEGEFLNEKDGSVLVFVPGATCPIGDDHGDSYERPARTVTVPPFFLGKYELTHEQFAAFVAATKHVTTAERENAGVIFEVTDYGEQLRPRIGASWRDPQGDGRAPEGRHPVTQVSYFDARAYAAWAGLDLPTEEMWERAAGWDPVKKRKQRYTWGDEPPGPGSPAYANLKDDAYCRAVQLPPVGFDDGWVRCAPVGTFPRDVAPCGALDMMGNVGEWCRHSEEEVAGDTLVFMRGGSWVALVGWTRVTNRVRAPAMGRTNSLGIRVALPAGP